jgi:hypothetical protein
LKLDRCLARELATWHFPMRKGFTNAWLANVVLQTRAI